MWLPDISMGILIRGDLSVVLYYFVYFGNRTFQVKYCSRLLGNEIIGYIVLFEIFTMLKLKIIAVS